MGLPGPRAPGTAPVRLVGGNSLQTALVRQPCYLNIRKEPDLVLCDGGALAPDLARACRAPAWRDLSPVASLRLVGPGPLVTHTGVGASAQAPASRVEEGAGSFINRGFLWLCTPTPCCLHLAGSSLGLKLWALLLGRDGAGWQARGERGLKCELSRRGHSGDPPRPVALG